MANQEPRKTQQIMKSVKKENTTSKGVQKKYVFIAIGVIVGIIVGTLFLIKYMNYYTSRDYLKEAKEFKEKGDDYWAMEYTKNALLYDNEYADAYSFKASLLLGWSNYEGCADVINSAMKYTDVPTTDIHFIYGKCLYKIGKFSESYSHLVKIYQTNPGRDSISLFMGDIYKREKLDYKEAAKAYRYFFDNHKNNVTSAMEAGECYFKLKNIPESIQFYNVVLKIDEDNADALFGLAKCYFEDGNEMNKACETALLSFKFGNSKAAGLIEAYCPDQVGALERGK